MDGRLRDERAGYLKKKTKKISRKRRKIIARILGGGGKGRAVGGGGEEGPRIVAAGTENPVLRARKYLLFCPFSATVYAVRTLRTRILCYYTKLHCRNDNTTCTRRTYIRV